ncbi:hypothetical protein T484DRAFT_1745943 [Baffinella frigidus]|nr:hypothetical protein T484DRAFT_1745943 [Cryptophyta sp. CCMP2293]
MGRRLLPSWFAIALALPLNCQTVTCFSPLASLPAQQRRSLHTATKMLVSPYATKPYPVGVAGTSWGLDDRKAWLARQVNQRSYAEEVLAKIEALKTSSVFTCEQYGELSVDPARYPLFVFKSREWDAAKPTCLVTGGVHGYETSGVQVIIL